MTNKTVIIIIIIKIVIIIIIFLPLSKTCMSNVKISLDGGGGGAQLI